MQQESDVLEDEIHLPPHPQPVTEDDLSPLSQETQEEERGEHPLIVEGTLVESTLLSGNALPGNGLRHLHPAHGRCAIGFRRPWQT